MRIPPHVELQEDEDLPPREEWIIEHPSGYKLHVERAGDIWSAHTEQPDDWPVARLLKDLVDLGNLVSDGLEDEADDTPADRLQEVRSQLGEIETVLHNTLLDIQALLRNLEDR